MVNSATRQDPAAASNQDLEGTINNPFIPHASPCLYMYLFVDNTGSEPLSVSPISILSPPTPPGAPPDTHCVYTTCLLMPIKTLHRAARGPARGCSCQQAGCQCHTSQPLHTARMPAPPGGQDVFLPCRPSALPDPGDPGMSRSDVTHTGSRTHVSPSDEPGCRPPLTNPYSPTHPRSPTPTHQPPLTHTPPPPPTTQWGVHCLCRARQKHPPPSLHHLGFSGTHRLVIGFTPFPPRPD